MSRYIIGISGASGIILAYKTIKALLELGDDIDLVFTQNASYAASLEMPEALKHPLKWPKQFSEEQQKKIKVHSINDVGATIGSGSYFTDGMIITPCSMATLAAIAIGLADNCLRRAADVMLKERRPLIIIPRETPFNEIHLEHMLKLTRMGVIIVPPIPAWYNHPQTVDDIENFIVGKSLDALRIKNNLYKRWKC